MPKQKEWRLRAKRRYRANHKEKVSAYNKWYYENYTKPKRDALKNHQSS